MRLFAGLDLSPDVIHHIERLIAALKPAARIQWSPAANLHITTKFIGEWPEERLDELNRALAGVPVEGPLTIAIRSLGFFPHARSPRVFWAGIDAPAQLASLARETDRALEPLGIEPEKRAYSPHLTLARIREPAPLAALHARLAELATQEFGTFTADRFFLYRSKLSPSGSVYTKISEFSLAK
jgi:2'-5' RNA ligase